MKIKHDLKDLVRSSMEETLYNGKKQRKYDMEYKLQSVKLAKELGGAKSEAELDIPENTMYAWTKAVREGRLDIGSGSHTPQTAMNPAQELAVLRRQMKAQEKEPCHLK